MMPRVLIGDDSLTVRMDLEETFRNGGFETTLCSTLAAVREALGSDTGGGTPDLLVLDRIFPDGNGIELLRDLRRAPETAALPVILLFAREAVADWLGEIPAGACEFAGKPYDTAELISRARELVANRVELAAPPGGPAGLPGLRRILAVDDSETYLQALASELRADGYEIVTAHSGQEALDRLAAETVDCILLDVVMPGFSGQETCQRIKLSAACREVPVLLLTAREDRETMLEGINAGADDYISKSSDFEIVRARVRAQLRRKHFEAENRRIQQELHRKELEASQERAARILAEHRAGLLEELGMKTRALQASEERLGRLVETIAEAIFIVERSGRITFANAAAEKLFGLERKLLTARTHDDPAWKQTAPGGKPFPPEDLPFQRVLRSREPVYGIEAEVERAGGTRLVVSINAAPLLDPAGEVAGVVASLSDITHRKEVERMKDEFVSTVSHELRTPLSCLRGFAELMLTREFAAEKQREFLGIIKDESVRLANLINDFLDLQRMESGRQRYAFKSVEVVPLLEGALSLFKQEAGGHRLCLEVASPLPPVWADADRIHQVLSNLISNALKFSPEGGEVKLGARPAEGGGVEVSVSDRGIGLPAEALPQLFSKFFRVDSQETRGIKGTGLGLAVVKEIVSAHRGRVWVESRPGKGSTFYFSLPGAERPGQAAQGG